MLSKQTKGKRGAVAVYVAILLVVFIGFTALAVDIGYVMVVRNQLQNAADAAALAGCNKFYSHDDPVTLPFPEPNWQDAESEAAEAVTDNKADNKQLEVGDIATGYWDITRSSLGLKRDKSTYTPTPNDGPAIEVAIAKTGKKNAGAIVTFFAGILGIKTVDLAAQATAVAASPGSVKPGSLVPIAIAKEVADLYGGTNTTLIIGSSYHYPNSEAGQWTTFDKELNNVDAIRNLIDFGNPTALTIGDKIWIQPGVKNTLYETPGQSKKVTIDSEYAGKDVFLPIVDCIINDETHSWQTLVGFIGFHIDYALGGSTKTVVGHFISDPVYGGGPIGPHYGPLDRCRLCQ